MKKASQTPCIFLVAGEPSGDVIGGRLIKALRQKSKRPLKIAGVGGESMEAAGLKSLFPIKDLAIVGLMEVIGKIPMALRRIKQTVAEIERVKPDLIVTIDSQSFSKRVNQSLKKRGCSIPIIQYVAPQVWAWKEYRKKTLHHYVDHLLTLLPFENKYFEPYGLKCTFVGHPVLEIKAVQTKAIFQRQNRIPPQNKIVCLLPGSRSNEVRRILPLFQKIVEKISANHPHTTFMIPTVQGVQQEVRAHLQKWAVSPLLIMGGEQNRYTAMAASDLAIAASGTVSLELAVLKIPHAIVYEFSALTHFIAKRLIKVPFSCLINLLLKRKVVPEFIQDPNAVSHISTLATKWLQKPALARPQQKAFEQALKLLKNGKEWPSQKAAHVILEHLKGS